MPNPSTIHRARLALAWLICFALVPAIFFSGVHLGRLEGAAKYAAQISKLEGDLNTARSWTDFWVGQYRNEERYADRLFQNAVVKCQGIEAELAKLKANRAMLEPYIAAGELVVKREGN